MHRRSTTTAGSPSLLPGMHRGVKCRPPAPSACTCPNTAPPASPSYGHVERSSSYSCHRAHLAVSSASKPKPVAVKQADFPRASRAARASVPSEKVRSEGLRLYAELTSALEARTDTERATLTTQAFRSHRASTGASGKGPGIRTTQRDQARINHLAAIKANDVSTNNSEPHFLLGGYTAPMLWDRLAESSLRSNAVNSSVLGRKKTEGAANQTTRINCKIVGHAASAQVVAVALATAEARRLLRAEGCEVVDPLATNAVNPCALALGTSADTARCDRVFAIASTACLVYNSSPAKLTSATVIGACQDLARRELEHYTISNAMGQRSSALCNICASIINQGCFDPVWCAWVLIVYLCSNPRGRDLLRQTMLTDVDVQAALAFVRYGGEEMGRRQRQRQEAKIREEKKRKANDEGRQPAAKRKRSPRSNIAAGGSDAHNMIELWNHSMVTSPDVSVLHTLAAHSKRTARDAALCTLKRQAAGSDVAGNKLLQNVSQKNAEKSAKAHVAFVGNPIGAPRVVLMRARREHDGPYGMACGIQRIADEGASSALHTCALPPLAVRPSSRDGIAIAWSLGATKLTSTSQEAHTVPGVLERLYEMQRTIDAAPDGRLRGKDLAKHGKMESWVRSESAPSMPTFATGTTRSFVSLRTRMTMNATHETAAAALVKEVHALASTVHRSESHGSASNEHYPTLVKSSASSAARVEPLCTPAPALAVGISISEALRRSMEKKTRRNNPCIVHLGHSTAAELAREVPSIMASEPMPLLTLTDFGIEHVGAPRDVADGLKEADAAMALHVCGEGAVRLPEMLAAMRDALPPREHVRQTRAALCVAASQASFVGSVGPALTAGYTNSAVASSKKISVPDVTDLMLLSPYDCYTAGLNNIQRSFDGTCYSGTYGCRVDTGFTMPGLLAHNLRSDNRQHGNCALSEEMANRLHLEFVRKHYITFTNLGVDASAEHGTRHLHTPTPMATRGIPHNFTPKVHSLLNDYCDFLQTGRLLSQRESSDTVDSIMCLPFSAFTQKLRPDVEPTADASLRGCFRSELETSVCTGRAHLINATAEARAIVCEPLFRRPMQISSGDCPFGTAYEAMDSFFSVCCTLALLAREAGRSHRCEARPAECVGHLHKLITEFVTRTTTSQITWDPAHCASTWASDALLLINVLYPSKLEVGEDALLPAFAKAVPYVQQHFDATETGNLALQEIPTLTAPQVADARAFWASFNRSESARCAWTWGLAPLLVAILEHNGSHEVGPETVAQFRKGLDRAVRAAWLVHSPDGVAPPLEPSPLAEVNAPSGIARHHVDPVFVGDEERGVVQRAALVGLKPHSLRQVLAEMLGARIEGVECNVAINEGGLSLRISSDATIHDKDGQNRTEKSISPTQTESDEGGYGTRIDKINGALRQKAAFDANALRLLPLCTAVEAPRASAHGEFGYSSAYQAESVLLSQDRQLPNESQTAAAKALAAAANPTVAKTINAKLFGTNANARAISAPA